MPFLEDDAPQPHRNILINRQQASNYCSNKISTAKYNFLTFLPRFLFEQFRKYANIFFLFIALMQQIPDVSPTGRYTTAFPLFLILTVSAIKEIIEDWRRHRADIKVNNRGVLVLRCGSWVEEKWKRIKVGDTVKILNNQFFPADLVLLASSEPCGMAYIETSNLDGETNLKIRQGHTVTSGLVNLDTIVPLSGFIECEPPNRHLYEFTGTLHLSSVEAVPLGPDQLLLRGAKLKNTNWLFGVVIYSGHDSKLMKNSSQAPLKRSNVDRVTNNQILVLFVLLLVVSLISAIAAELWTSKYGATTWYLGFPQRIASSNFGYNLLTFVILYNNLIPISLQVTLEVVRFFQAVFINQDIDMYDEEADQPAMARTSNLNEELGQVKYIFCDKTGTLTRNIMIFKKCSVAGIMYGSDSDPKFVDKSISDNLSARHITAPIIREFLTLMSICHTIIPEKDHNAGKITYQASSPDEAALVKGAKDIGYTFHTRIPAKVTIDAQGTEQEYEILNVLEFTSERKRMGVIVRTPDRKITLYVKGADSEIFSRLAPNQIYNEVTLRHLEEFAQSGYRTLCLAKVDIKENEYNLWRAEFHEASIALDDRRQKLHDVCDKIEKNLFLLGATAIEDKLQKEVPETIASLIKADIRVWMLTGDKQETAINIGHSCKLLAPNMPIMIINKECYEDTFDAMKRYWEDLGPSHIREENDLGLVVDGKSLMYALMSEARRIFLDLAVSCRVVICCRVTPMQKAEVVELIKRSVGAITLAIGDGANDVAMIQAAHVGVGISGQEGLQAACASDYAIAQFRFLSKLLFVHGAWSFQRLVKLILYSFHKNICLYIIELWFAIYSAWSGQTLFERWCIGLYNVFFTAAPPLAIGLFDRTATAETMLKYPALYKLSQNRESFSVKIFWLYIFNAIYHSILLFWLGKAALEHGVAWSNGRTGGWLMLGNSVYTYVVVTVCLKAGLEVDAWTWVTQLSIWGSVAAWFIFLFIYCNMWPTFNLAPEMKGMDVIMFSSCTFWFGLVLIPFTTILVDFVAKIVKRTLFRTIADDVREMELSVIDPTSIIQKLTRRSKRSSKMRNVRVIESSTARTTRESFLDPLSDEDEGVEDGKQEEIIQKEARAPTRNGKERRRRTGLIPSVRLSETARLLRNVFKRSSSGVQLAEDAQHGYAFSQEEYGAVRQSDLIRAYDSTVVKPEGF